jgi:uncharacterized protein (DUF924 family)
VQARQATLDHVFPELRHVLEFWFDELKPPSWFTRDDAVDAKVSSRFADLYQRMQQDPPAACELSTAQVVAAVIVLDQFPRNMFRQSPQAFATDAVALQLSQQAVAAGLDRQLGISERGRAMRQFLYMPFMHSEDAAVQLRSLELFTPLGEEAFSFARQHQEIIARFGRFPHRNVVLNRPSTPEEEEFLKTHRGF